MTVELKYEYANEPTTTGISFDNNEITATSTDFKFYSSPYVPEGSAYIVGTPKNAISIASKDDIKYLQSQIESLKDQLIVLKELLDKKNKPRDLREAIEEFKLAL